MNEEEKNRIKAYIEYAKEIYNIVLDEIEAKDGGSYLVQFVMEKVLTPFYYFQQEQTPPLPPSRPPSSEEKVDSQKIIKEASEKYGLRTIDDYTLLLNKQLSNEEFTALNQLLFKAGFRYAGNRIFRKPLPRRYGYGGGQR